MTTNQNESSSTLEQLPDDILGNVLLFCDFASAFNLAKRTNRALQERSERVNLHHVWEEIFRRHNFSPIEDGDDDFMAHCQRRRKLFHNLLKNERTHHYYKMPDRFFSFHPIVPKEDIALEKRTESETDSFALTSTATSPELVLLDPSDGNLSVISNTFIDSSSRKSQDRQVLLKVTDNSQLDLDHSEFEFVYAGTESKPIIDSDASKVVGTLVWAGRFITRAARSEVLCTEITAWVKGNNDSRYSNQMTCYIPGTFSLADVDAKNQRVFASFQEDEELRSLKGNPSPRKNQILVYPLDPQDSQVKKDSFSEPLFTIECQYPISAFSVDATGESLCVATTKGTLEIWKITPRKAHKLETIHLRPALKAGIQSRLSTLRQNRGNGGKVNDRATNDPCILRCQLEQLSAAPVEAFFLPKHLPMEECGFVTSQKDGTTLLLWKQSQETGRYEITSLINLPLSPKRTPQVKYDGSRLIVFGQNDEGGTILVYHVACSDMPVERKQRQNHDLPSGGVHNLTSPAIGFANQIGHDSLADIDKFSDSIHMECNERFIMVNTKVPSQSHSTDGLLVIDLEQ